MTPTLLEPFLTPADLTDSFRLELAAHVAIRPCLPPSTERLNAFAQKPHDRARDRGRPIRRLIVEVLIPRNIATRAKLPASATATKYCNSSGSIDACRIPRREHPSERRRDPSSVEEEFRHRSFKFRGLALLVRTRRRRFQQTCGSALIHPSGASHHVPGRG
jgi:hypothetical protein